MAKTEPLDISVIIPFKDKVDMTLLAVSSFIEHGPPVREFLLISNNSSAEELAKIQREAPKLGKHCKVLIYDFPFNYQKINNWGAEHAQADFLLFLNNDTEMVTQSEGLIEHMFELAQKPKVGIVGCLLLYGDASTIQHAGVYLVPQGTADHMYIGKKYARAVREAGTPAFPYDITKDIPMTAVTGAVNLVERKKFDAIKGFDERFIVCGGDVDLCIRHNKAGYQTMFAGGGYIIHKESQSRAHKPVAYNDFYYSYLSYINGYDTHLGDPYLPKITAKTEV